MNPTLEQIKTDESVWPDGASHCIGSRFTKWVSGVEHLWCTENTEWVCKRPIWSLEDYEANGFPIIPRPNKEWVPKIGEWCISSGGAEVFYVGLDDQGCHVFSLESGGFTAYDSLAGFKPFKSERDLFVDKINEIINKDPEKERMPEMLYDLGLRFMEKDK